MYVDSTEEYIYIDDYYTQYSHNSPNEKDISIKKLNLSATQLKKGDKGYYVR